MMPVILDLEAIDLRVKSVFIHTNAGTHQEYRAEFRDGFIEDQHCERRAVKMATQLTVISRDKQGTERKVLLPEGKFRHFQNILGVVLQDAQDTWGDLWKELQGEVTDGFLILPETGKGIGPRCGWPEFLEKMWLLKHYLDYAKRFSEGKP